MREYNVQQIHDTIPHFKISYFETDILFIYLKHRLVLLTQMGFLCPTLLVVLLWSTHFILLGLELVGIQCRHAMLAMNCFLLLFIWPFHYYYIGSYMLGSLDNLGQFLPCLPRERSCSKGQTLWQPPDCEFFETTLHDQIKIKKQISYC